MNLSTLQFIQPINADTRPFRVIARRLGWVAFVYVTIALVGAVLAGIVTSLGWSGLALAVAGGSSGLFLAYSVMLTVFVYRRSMHPPEPCLIVRPTSQTTHSDDDDDSALVDSVWSLDYIAPDDSQHFDPEVTQPFRKRRLLYVPKYLASIWVFLVPFLIASSHGPIVFWGSGIVGLILGGMLILIARFVFHVRVVHPDEETRPHRSS